MFTLTPILGDIKIAEEKDIRTGRARNSTRWIIEVSQSRLSSDADLLPNGGFVPPIVFELVRNGIALSFGDLLAFSFGARDAGFYSARPFLTANGSQLSLTALHVKLLTNYQLSLDVMHSMNR